MESDLVPRTARQYNEFTKVYHVILRGIDRQDIFLDEQDKKKWIKELINTKVQFNYDLYCYCLMNNHVHMVLYDKNMQLSKIIQSLAIRYATYFNKKYERVGHLFQNRFLKSISNWSEKLKRL